MRNKDFQDGMICKLAETLREVLELKRYVSGVNTQLMEMRNSIEKVASNQKRYQVIDIESSDGRMLSFSVEWGEMWRAIEISKDFTIDRVRLRER